MEHLPLHGQNHTKGDFLSLIQNLGKGNVKHQQIALSATHIVVFYYLLQKEFINVITAN